AAVGLGMHGGRGGSFAVAVPLDDVEFALSRAAQPEGGPGARGQAVERDPGLPGVSGAAFPHAGQLAEVIGREGGREGNSFPPPPPIGNGFGSPVPPESPPRPTAETTRRLDCRHWIERTNQ